MTEDLTPTPTQAEMDDLAGGKDRKIEPRKAEEYITPTPTQAEADEAMVKLVHGENAKVERREVKQEEVLPPTPTQAECDAAKIAAMPGDAARAEPDAEPKRKQAEAAKPAATYQTRAVKPAPASEPSKPAE